MSKLQDKYESYLASSEAIDRVRKSFLRRPNTGTNCGPAKKASLTRGQLLDSRPVKLSTISALKGTSDSKGLNAYDAISYDPIPRLVTGKGVNHLGNKTGICPGIKSSIKTAKPVLDADNKHVVLASRTVSITSFKVVPIPEATRTIGKPGLIVKPILPATYRRWLDKNTTNHVVNPSAIKHLCSRCGMADSRFVVNGGCNCNVTIRHNEFVPGYLPMADMWLCEYMPGFGC